MDENGSKIPDDWRRLHAFGLPGGSVRALLAIGVFATIWVLLLTRPERALPPYLQNLLFIIMGHYFAVRARTGPAEEPGPPPLYLPRGTVRLLLIGGFVAVAATLHLGGQLLPLRTGSGAMTLVLVAGFLLGVVVAHARAWWLGRGRRPPRWLEDARAGLALAAAVLLVALVLNRAFAAVALPETLVVRDIELNLGGDGVEQLLAAVVGFYFGSRS